MPLQHPLPDRHRWCLVRSRPERRERSRQAELRRLQPPAVPAARERLELPKRVAARLVVVRPRTGLLGPAALRSSGCPTQTSRPVHSTIAMALGARREPPTKAPWWPAVLGLTRPQVRQGERPSRSLPVQAQVLQAQPELEQALRPTKEPPADSRKEPRARPPALARAEVVNPKPVRAQPAHPIPGLVRERRASLKASSMRVPEREAEQLAQPIPTSAHRRREAKKASRATPTSARELEVRPKTEQELRLEM